MNITIENIVVKVTTESSMDLNELNEKLGGKFKNNFPALIYKPKESKATSLIFRSGKLIFSGAKSLEDCNASIEKTLAEINKVILLSDNYDNEIVNIVATSSFKSILDLNMLALELEDSEYEPEQFPGLVYRMDNPNLTFLLFGSGKVCCTGVKSFEDMEIGVKKLYKILNDLGVILE